MWEFFLLIFGDSICGMHDLPELGCEEDWAGALRTGGADNEIIFIELIN